MIIVFNLYFFEYLKYHVFSIHCFSFMTVFSLPIFLLDNELVYFRINVLYTLEKVMLTVSMANNLEMAYTLYFMSRKVLSA